MKIKLSIIIPAHNCEATLEQAIVSIYDGLSSQEAEQIQTIIVENGSNDHTEQVAQNVRGHYPQILLTHSQPGVSKARNRGLEFVTGKWILFLDADDYYLPGMIKKILLRELKEDLLVYSFESGDALKKLFDQEKHYQQDNKTSLIELAMENPTNYLTVWGKVFNYQLILEHHLQFNEELNFSEDSLFVLRYLLVAQKALGLSEVLYHYTREATSAVRSFNNKKTQEYLQALTAVYQLITTTLPEAQASLYIYGLMQVNLIGVHGIYDANNPAGTDEKKKQLKRVLKHPIVNECFSRTPITRMRAPRFAAVILLKLHCYALAGKIFELRSRGN